MDRKIYPRKMSRSDFCRKLGLYWHPEMNSDMAFLLSLPDAADTVNEETDKLVETMYNAHELVENCALDYGERVKQYKILGDGAYSLGKYGPAFYHYRKMFYNNHFIRRSEIHSYVRTCKSDEEYTDAVRYYNEVYELVKEYPELSYDVMCNYAKILAQAQEPFDKIEYACGEAIEASYKLNDIDKTVSVLKSLTQYQQQYNETDKLENTLKIIQRLQFDGNEQDVDNHTVCSDSSDNQEQQPTHVEGTDVNDCLISNVKIEPTILNTEINETESSTSKLHQSALDERVIPIRNAKGENQLHIACLDNCTELVRHLVMVDKFPVNLKDNEGWTALHIACQVGNVEIVEVLINNEAEVNAVNNVGGTPMMGAAVLGHFNIVEILLEKGASCLLKTNAGCTVLDCMDFRIQSRNRVNKDKETIYTKLRNTIEDIIINSTTNDSASVTCEPLPSTSGLTANNQYNDEGNLDKIKKEYISEPLESSKDNNEAVVNIKTEPDEEMPSFLDGVHVDDADENIAPTVDIGTRLWNELPLDVRCSKDLAYFKSKMRESFQLICGAGDLTGANANDNSTCNVKIEPITLNIETNETESSTSKLHESALDKRVIPKRNAKGENQLHIACLDNRTETVRHLVMVDKFPVNLKDNDDWTALHVACQFGNVEIVEILVNNGADVNAVNHAGGTPMMTAAIQGHFNIVEILLGKGAKCEIKTSGGYTALDCMDDWIKYKKRVGKDNLNLYKNLRKTMEAIIINSTINNSLSVTCEPLPSTSGIKRNHENNDEGNFDKNKKQRMRKPPENSTNDDDAVIDIKKEADEGIHSSIDDAHVDENFETVPTTGADANDSSSSDIEKQPTTFTCNINETTKSSRSIHQYIIKKRVIPKLNCHREDQLNVACLNYSKDTLMRLVTHNKVPVNLKDDEGWTILHIACQSGLVAVVEVLIKNGADVNAINFEGVTPMISAGFKGYFDIVKILLENGASCQLKTNSGLTVLDSMDNWMKDKQNVKKDIEILYKNLRNTIEGKIKDSSTNNNESVMCEPLASTSGISANNKNNDEGNLDQNKKGSNSKPLDRRSNYNETVVDTTPEADVETRCVYIDDTAEDIRTVPTAGADVNSSLSDSSLSDVEKEQTPWTCKIKKTENCSRRLSRASFKKGAIPKKNGYNDKYPLHNACLHSTFHEVKHLVTREKVSVNLQDHEGWTALHLASQVGVTNMVKILIKNGADINAINAEGATPMMSAGVKGRFEAVKLLLESGASCLIKTNSGLTVLDGMDYWMKNQKNVTKYEYLLYKRLRKTIEDIINNSTINQQSSTFGITANNQYNDEGNLDKNKKEYISEPLESSTDNNVAVVNIKTQADEEMRSVHTYDADENNTTAPTIDTQRRSKLVDYRNRLETDDTISAITKMAIIDGIPLEVIVSSEEKKEWLTRAGYKNIPNSLQDVNNIIKAKTKQLEEEAKQNLKYTCGELLSLTLDELILGPDHKYFDIKIHTTNNRVPNHQINLGLLRIKESDTVDDILNNLKEKLAYFNLTLDKHIGCITTDSTNVIAKTVKNVKCQKLICFADILRRAIIKVLYNNANSTIDKNLARGDADNSEISVPITKNNTSNQISSDTDIELIEILRKVVYFMKVYSTKTEDKNLILNCEKNWSALTDLLGSFLELYNTMNETDRTEININIDDRNSIDELWRSLVCIRNQINLLYNADINIEKASLAINCILRDLSRNQCKINRLLRSKISENYRKRSEHDSILYTLHFFYPPDVLIMTKTVYEIDTYNVYNNYGILITKIFKVGNNLFNVLKDNNIKENVKNENLVEKSTSANNLNDNSKLISNVGSYNDFSNQIHMEIEQYYNGHNLDNTKYLKLICNFLKCIPVVSTSKEKVFSTVNDNNLKCSYNNDIIETLGLLRYYYLQDK